MNQSSQAHEADVSLRDYLVALLTAVDEQSQLRDAALKERVEKTEVDFNVRMQATNGFRAQLSAQRAEFATNERLDDTANTMRALYDALSKSLNTNTETLRAATARDIEVLRDRFDREGHLRDEALNALGKQLPNYMPLAKADSLMTEGRAQWDALQARIEREGKARDDAINSVQQTYAGLVGRISGMGIVAVLVSLALQIILFLATHKLP